MGYSPVMIIGFAVVVLLALAVDLFAHSNDKPVTVKNAAAWSAIWVAVSLAFAGFLRYDHGSDTASLFLAGYALEKSLSVDNLFVFMAIFASFKVKPEFQHRILYFGILGAIVLRLVFVAFGSVLLHLDEIFARFLGIEELAISVPGFGKIPVSLDKTMFIIFGIIVLWTAYKMFLALRQGHENATDETDYTHHWAVRWTEKLFPVQPRLSGHKFFVRNAGKLMVTPLFLCLVVVEFSDVIFAFDSVPAVIAVTKEPFLVYTSNIFAILGLRSMYFLLVAAEQYLCHLTKAVVAILAFIGGKLLLDSFGIIHVAPTVSLAIVLLLLAIGILASVVYPVAKTAAALGEPGAEAAND